MSRYARGEPIIEARPFGAPGVRGRWPCAFCGELFPVSESWQVTVAGGRRGIACASCVDAAAEARGARPGRGSKVEESR